MAICECMLHPGEFRKIRPKSHLRTQLNLPSVILYVGGKFVFFLGRYPRTTASQKRKLFRPNSQAVERKALSIKHKPRPKRSYLDVGIGSVCLSGDDTGGA